MPMSANCKPVLYAIGIAVVFVINPASALSHELMDDKLNSGSIERSKRSDDPSPLQTVVDSLVQEVNSLKAEVTTLKTRQDETDRSVAFHAWTPALNLSATSQGTIILKHAETNVGGGYDPQTGFFTAPVSGLYLFYAKIMVKDFNKEAWAGIYVGNKNLVMTVSDSRHGFRDNPSLAAVAHMSQGQRAQLKNTYTSPAVYYGGYYTSFSGALIRAD